MNPETQRIFHEVADLSPSQRERYFDQHGIGEAVRAEVNSLLSFDDGATQYLAEQLIAGVATATDDSGSRCGPWQLTRQLGSGGMGAVYLASRDDGEVEQQAAVKLIRAGGVNLRARFLRERQILASLNHAYIARLLDAGHRPDGQPFLVMEYVEGTPIDRFCTSLPLPETIRLFIKVCDAVAHAHRNLVIHRDLKPSNILITSGGDPKLLDFGIAKVIDSSEDTLTVERFLTPGYSSPEQVQGGAIGTATDVYSLGAVLYRLLTGVSPHDPTAANSALHQEPKLPSAFRRNTERDLDAIVMKALRKEPGDRYATVEQLSEDLLAYLESRPVRATAAGRWYRARKFARRYSSAVAAVAAVFVALVTGVVASTWQAARAVRAEQAALLSRDRANEAGRAAMAERDRASSAERTALLARDKAAAAELSAARERDRAIDQKRRADDEAATAKAISAFLQYDLLAHAGATAQAAPGAKPDPDLKVRTALDRAAARISGRFNDQPVVEAALRFTIGGTYRDLSLFKEARPQLERAVELTKARLGEEHAHTLDSMNLLAAVYQEQGEYANAEQLFAKVLAIRKRVFGENHESTVGLMNNLALLYRYQGKHTLAESLQEKVLDIRLRELGEEHARTQTNMVNLALTYADQGKYAEAEKLHSRVVEIRRRLMGEEHPATLNAMTNLEAVYYQQSRYAESEQLLRRSLEIQRRIRGERHSETLVTLSHLARVVDAQGRTSEAEPLYVTAAEARRASLGVDHPTTLLSEHDLAQLYWRQGKRGEAEKLLVKVLSARRRVLGPDHPHTLSTLLTLGTVLLEESRPKESEPMLAEAVAGFEKRQSESWTRHQAQVMRIVQLYQQSGKAEQAAEWRARLKDATLANR